MIGTYFYFEKMHKELSYTTDEKPIAHIGQNENITRKKPAKHRMWNTVNFGDPLFDNESIKTSSDAEVRILFADSDRYIDLEPDSLITLKKNKGEIALNLLEGNLFVNSSGDGKGSDTTSLTLESDQGKIDLSKTQASLSKSGNKELNLKVIKGSAAVTSKDGQEKVISSGSTGSLTDAGLEYNKETLKILAPLAQEVFELEDQQLKDFKVQWQGQAANSSVKAFIGLTRKSLVEVQGSTVTTNGMNIPVKYGRYFLKLQSVDSTGHVLSESTLSKFEIKQKASAIQNVQTPKPVVAPLDVQFVQPESLATQTYYNEPSLKLSWKSNRPEEIAQYRINLSGEGEEKIQFTASESKFNGPLKKPGRYIASIEAVNKNGEVLTKSKDLVLKIEEAARLLAPEWTQKSDHLTATSEGSLKIDWQKRDGAKEYELQLLGHEGKELKKWRQKTTTIKFQNLLPGEHKLKVTSIDEHDRPSDNQSIQVFRVPELSALKAPKLKGFKIK